MILTLCLTLISSNVAVGYTKTGAESFLKSFDFETDTVLVVISDGVSDGCLASPQSVLNVLEVELRRLGIKATQKGELGRFAIALSVTGYAVSSRNSDDLGCIAAVRSRFYMTAYARLENSQDSLKMIFPTLVESTQLYSSGEKYAMQSRIEGWAKEVASDVFLQLSRAKD